MLLYYHRYYRHGLRVYNIYGTTMYCIPDTLPSTLCVGRVEEPSAIHLLASANCIFYTLPSLEHMGRAGSVLLTKYRPAACFDLWPNQDTIIYYAAFSLKRISMAECHAEQAQPHAQICTHMPLLHICIYVHADDVFFHE